MFHNVHSFYFVSPISAPDGCVIFRWHKFSLTTLVIGTNFYSSQRAGKLAFEQLIGVGISGTSPDMDNICAEVRYDKSQIRLDPGGNKFNHKLKRHDVTTLG